MADESFASPAIARDWRDLIDKRVIQVIDQNRPPYQYATVDSIDTTQAWLLFPGATNAVPVKFGSIAPTAIGQVVRVDGRPGDRFIVDVIGAGSVVDVSSEDLPPVLDLAVSSDATSLFIDWTNNAAPRYEVNVADDSGFTTNNRIFLTQSSSITVNDLNTGTTYYVRVRSRNSGNGGGAWSATETGTPTATGVPPTDGIPPDSSPQPTVTAGIAMISAEWVPAIGTVDAITYEVHVSTSSGFTPSAATLLVETTSRFANTAHMPDGTSLQTLTGTNVFVRLIAKDPDGSAAVGAQGFAAPLLVETGDVGTIEIGQVSDLVAPSSSPQVTLASGVGYLFAAWDAGVNGVAAQGTLTVAAAVTDGDTFTIGTKVYTLQTSLTDVDGNINIGGSLAQTKLNIIAAIGLTGTPGTDYALSMTLNTSVLAATFIANDSILTARIANAAGNSIVTTETFFSGSNFFDAGTLGTTTTGVEPTINADPVDYEVHLSTTTDFTPVANTLVGNTPSLFFFITNESVQIDPAEPIVDHTVTYYCKIVATDIDGTAPAGVQDSASPVNPASVDNTTVESP